MKWKAGVCAPAFFHFRSGLSDAIAGSPAKLGAAMVGSAISEMELQQARQAVTRGDIAGADAHFRSAIEKAPEARRPEILHEWGELALRQESATDAINRFGAAVQGAPRSARHAKGLARAHSIAGRYWSAARALSYAGGLAPDDRELHGMMSANALLRGDPETSFNIANQLAAFHPDDMEARLARGDALLEGEYVSEALEDFDAAVQLDGRSRTAQFKRALALSRMNAFDAALEAIDRFEKNHGASGGLTHLRARTLMEAGDLEAARHVLSDGPKGDRSADGQIALRLRLDRLVDGVEGVRRSAARLIDDSSNAPHIAMSVISALKTGEQFDLASELVNRLPDETAQSPFTSLLKASILDESEGDFQAALHLLAPLATSFDEHESFAITHARCLLKAGQWDAASQVISLWRARKPNDQYWLGLQCVLLRASGQTGSYKQLCDVDRYVKAYTLKPPPGYPDIEAFNAALMTALDPLFPSTRTPMDQSMRGGGQTIRSLVHERDPVLRAYYQALRDPVQAYLADLEAGADHPLKARQTEDIQFQGSWSVRLRKGGRHVNHVHTQGWISSAYYVATPAGQSATQDAGGAITFGEAPFAVPGASGPERRIQPKAGQVVLFPSFMWHGVEPTQLDALRVTAPFDVAPYWRGVQNRAGRA